jgi:hypothetical protein
MLRTLMNKLFRRTPSRPEPVLTLIPGVCIACGRGCKQWEQGRCAIVHAHRQQFAERAAEDPERFDGMS